ncbi:hypothetical protein L2E82_30810 [Cichorium intybus]|uniref:Uncharacterized protein n=1 Tax=Cichorium intybus TaxID=13427 RepID=A0ACB9D253_CICIN|nr:hypothetical protein L2E82_30810 [Cichorium intybus]
MLLLNVKSPHRNSTFQKLFNLPPEEFLISDFSCSLKRKFPFRVDYLYLKESLVFMSTYSDTKQGFRSCGNVGRGRRHAPFLFPFVRVI